MTRRGVTVMAVVVLVLALGAAAVVHWRDRPPEWTAEDRAGAQMVADKLVEEGVWAKADLEAGSIWVTPSMWHGLTGDSRRHVLRIASRCRAVAHGDAVIAIRSLQTDAIIAHHDGTGDHFAAGW